MQLAKSGQLAQQNANSLVISPRMTQESRQRFDNVINSIVQKNKENRELEERANAVQNYNIQRENFELPNIAKEKSSAGQMQQQIEDELENRRHNINHSGNIIDDSEYVSNRVSNQLAERIQYKVKAILSVIIVVIVILLLAKMLTLQRNVETLLQKQNSPPQYRRD